MQLINSDISTKQLTDIKGQTPPFCYWVQGLDIMNICSQETLRWVQENHDKLTELRIGGGHRGFASSVGDDYSRLGAAVGENTHLKKLVVVLDDDVASDVTNNAFYDGLKQNSSIQVLTIHCSNSNIAGGVGQKILEAYQENNGNLTVIIISRVDLQNGGEHIIAETLRRCTNLQEVCLYNCDSITEEKCFPMIEAVRGHRSLEKLDLHGNRIGNAGCETLADLLEDPRSNLQTLNLGGNDIGNDGAATIANSLTNNTKLQHLSLLYSNPIDSNHADDIFSRILCNTSSINKIYLSNHTIVRLGLGRLDVQLESLLKLNEGTNKSHVAIKKILRYHTNIDIDMKPLFGWNMEGEGERDLKALPYVVAWFERAGEAVADDEDEGGEESYKICERKISALYHFAKAMPLLVVPVPPNKRGDNKRKRDGK